MTKRVPDSGENGFDAAGGGQKMSLIDHLEELRWTLIRCICAIVVCAVPCGIFWRRIFDAVAVWPLRLSGDEVRIIYTAPAEAIMLSVKIALTGGVILASPFIFQQIWSFVSPGLYKKEKKIALPAALASTLCFLAGIAFCYILLPMLLKFLTSFAGERIEPFFKVNEYFGFIIKMCIVFGLAFELPVIAFVLSKLGVIDHRFMIRYFRLAIILIFILAAVLTPPDGLSQILLGVPLVGLYALSILVSFLARQRVNLTER